MTQDEALTILKTGANVFLTGEPGSGKTHTVNAYVSWLHAHGVEPAITASTGIAATHIGGHTIHSWSGIGVKRVLSAYDLDKISQTERIVRHVRGTNILIIDEVSMLSGDTLSMVDAVLCEIRGSEKAFGGMQVILVGDFFQLPPISRHEENVEQESLMDDSSRSQFAFGSPAWESLNPIVCYLSEQHRQEDEKFLEILSAIRRGEVEDEHRELLMQRRGSGKDTQAAQLFSHNADVNQINDAELAKISESSHVFTMSGRGSEGMIAALKRGCLSPEVLALKVGARVMFTKNDIAGRAYVNGTLGVVTGFAKENGYPIVKMHNGRTMVVEPAEWRVDDNGKTLAHINQLPLRLAWAMTVHKSQGMSLDAAHMDLSAAFEYGQGYVALSRVRTLAGLSLAGLNERALQVHPEIQEQDRTFRQQSEVARQAFAKIPQTELKQMQENFIRASGGHITPKAKAVEEEPGQSKLDKIREKHPNAYRPWSKEEDESLKEKFLAGEQGKALAEAFGRKPNAIKMRLIKLGLIEEE
jgi:ATP-dependent exoDNAse (exonuclease V) alpha subunit